MCKEITNRIHLQGGFTMVFLLTLVYLHTRLHFTTAYKNWNKRIIWLWARILPYGPSPGTAANYNMGSQLWKKLLNPCYSLYTLSLKYVHLIFLLLVVTVTVFDTWVICPWRGTAWRPRFLSMSVTLKTKYNYHGCLHLTRVLAFKQLHINISMHILHTVLSTFLKVLPRRICKAIKSFFCRQTFPLWLWP